jgi:hypothetical protein
MLSRRGAREIIGKQIPRGRQICFEGKVQAKQPIQNKEAKDKLTEYTTPKGEFNDDVFPSLIAELTDLRGHLTSKNSIEEIPLQERPGQRQSAFWLSKR